MCDVVAGEGRHARDGTVRKYILLLLTVCNVQYSTVHAQCAVLHARRVVAVLESQVSPVSDERRESEQ